MMTWSRNLPCVFSNYLILAHHNAESRKVPTKRLSHLQRKLAAISTGLSSLPDGDDGITLLHQYDEQLAESKIELTEARNLLYTLDIEDTDDLNVLLSSIEKTVFDRSLDIRKLLMSRTPTVPGPASTHASSSAAKGIKLPKIEVPTFDGNLLHWSTFWEQFEVSVHDKDSLSDAEKLVYLQHALKGGAAKQAIEGLSRSGDQYAEAVESLKDRYNRPRLIHQSHVRMIVEAPSLKDGSGKELRRLHDVVQQHIRALKSLGHDPPGPFITSLIELRLDTTTMFEWQRHSQGIVLTYHTMMTFSNFLTFVLRRRSLLRRSQAGAQVSNRGNTTLVSKLGCLPMLSIAVVLFVKKNTLCMLVQSSRSLIMRICCPL